MSLVCEVRAVDLIPYLLPIPTAHKTPAVTTELLVLCCDATSTQGMLVKQTPQHMEHILCIVLYCLQNRHLDHVPDLVGQNRTQSKTGSEASTITY